MSIISSIVSSELALADGTPLVLKVSPRARVMRLRVDARTGSLLLTVPRRMSQRRALEWANSQSAWVQQALSAVPRPVPLEPGTVIPFRGLDHRIDWDSARPRTVRAEAGALWCGGPAEGLEARLLRWLRREALDQLGRETRDCAARLGLRVAKVAVGDPVSRWGSCSSCGTIRYNWRLILAPEFVRRATVAHEVAHLVHMNHGPQFHALVEKLLEADPAPARLWLRHQGGALHRIGRRA